MKSLTVCPNGELISPREKLVAMVLADSHQDRAGYFTYPAVETIAEESVCDKRSCQRYLAALERKGVIRRLRPANQGRSMRVFYFFAELDEVPKGWQGVTLLFAERVAKGRQKGGKRVTDSQLALMERAQEREPEPEQKQIPPPNPLAGEGECGEEENDDACKAKKNAAEMAGNCVPICGNKLAEGGRAGQVGVVPNARSLDPSEGCVCARGTNAHQLEAAVDQVMSGLGMTKRRDRRRIRAVIEMETDKGEPPPTVALSMMAAYRRQDAARLRGELTASYGVMNFFERGVWKTEGRWHWNEEVLRQRSQASVGSGR